MPKDDDLTLGEVRRWTEEQVVQATVAYDTSIRRARKIFSQERARLETLQAQAKPIGIIDTRRLEFEAVIKIRDALKT